MRPLKVVLVALGLLCFLGSAPGAVAPWSSVVHWMGLLGLEALPDHPYVIYCVRLSSLGFALIGVFFLVLAANPLRYRPLLVLAVWGLVLMAVLAVTTGRAVAMRPPWYWADAFFCLLAAVLILVFWPRAQETPSVAEEAEG